MLSKKTISKIRVAIFILLLASLVFSLVRPPEETIYEVRINKQIVGHCEDRSDMESMIGKIESELAESYYADEISPYYEVAFAKVKRGDLTSTSYENLKREVLANQKFVTAGYELTIDEKVYATAINRDDLDFLLNNVKSRLKNDHESIQSISFRESVEIAPGNIFLRDSIGQTQSDLLVERLLTGRTQIETYTVKPGDTITAIASGKGLSVGDIAEANPETDIDRIYAGQKLYLSKPSPILHRK